MANILLIDDSAIVRESLCKILTLAGHRIEQAPDGLKGVELFGGGQFDMVITDIFMPNEDGISAIRQIRSKNPDVAIIAMSGSGQDLGQDFLRMSAALGADYTLRKPFFSSELLATVDQAAAKNGRTA